MASRSISQCNCAFASVNRRTTARPKVISCENVDTSNINSNYFNERVTEGGLPGYQKLLGREPAEQDRVAEYVFIATGLETWKIMRNLGKSWEILGHLELWICWICWIQIHRHLDNSRFHSGFAQSWPMANHGNPCELPCESPVLIRDLP